MKCTIKGCGSEATYNSPRPYCDHHWAKWFAKGMEPRDREMMYKTARQQQSLRYGRIAKKKGIT